MKTEVTIASLHEPNLVQCEIQLIPCIEMLNSITW